MNREKHVHALKAFLKKNETIQFLDAAQQFVTVLENKRISNKLFYKKSHKALLALYIAGHKLGYLKSQLRYDYKNTKYPLQEYKQYAAKIATLGDDVFYWEVFNPTQKEIPVQGWLADDFYDIYCEIKDALYLIQQVATDEAIAVAFWQLKLSFNKHWGNHAIDALRCLHYLNNKIKLEKL